MSNSAPIFTLLIRSSNLLVTKLRQRSSAALTAIDRVQASPSLAMSAEVANRLPLDTRRVARQIGCAHSQGNCQREGQKSTIDRFSCSGAAGNLQQPYRPEYGDRFGARVRARLKSAIDLLIFLAMMN